MNNNKKTLAMSFFSIFLISLAFAQSDSTPLDIVDIHVGENSIAFDVKDENIPTGYLYYLGCVEVGNELWTENPKTTRPQITNNVSSYIQLMIGGLKENADYKCNVSIMKPSGGGMSHIRRSNQILIKMGEPFIFDKFTQDQYIPIVASPEYEKEIITEIQPNPFSDTNLNSLEGKAAAELQRRSVIGGFPDGEFKGSRNVNRAEAAKFLLLASNTNIQSSKDNKFWDVKYGEWYEKYVITAAQQGIINGYEDGSFRPANTVNTAEFIKMLTISFNLPENLEHSYQDVSADFWFAKYAGIANKYNLFPNRNFTHLEPGRYLSRNEVAIAIYQYLENH